MAVDTGVEMEAAAAMAAVGAVVEVEAKAGAMVVNTTAGDVVGAEAEAAVAGQRAVLGPLGPGGL